jgi:nitrite reductase (NO-forming)
MMIKRRFAVLTIAALALAACGGDDGDSPGGGGAAPAVGDDGRVEIDVVMGDIFYQPDRVEIPGGTTVVVHASNEGQVEHDFELEDGQGTGMVDPGDSATAEIGPIDEDTVAFCTVPGHREAGMEFRINVSG